jgi:hypothetical protein
MILIMFVCVHASCVLVQLPEIINRIKITSPDDIQDLLPLALEVQTGVAILAPE